VCGHTACEQAEGSVGGHQRVKGARAGSGTKGRKVKATQAFGTENILKFQQRKCRQNS